MQDPIGHQTLEIMAQADYYNRWIYSLVKPYVSGRVAEVGAGTGTFSQLLVQDGFRVTAIDFRQEYLDIISQKSKKIETFLFDMQQSSLPPAISAKFDTIIILNVLEHLSDHVLAMKHLFGMLKSGGTLVVLVPSFQIAFGSLDTNLGHFRRYTKDSFNRVARGVGFNPVTSRYINFLGLIGWLVNARIFKSKMLSGFQIKAFNLISRPFLAIEKVIAPPLGLSLISIVTKP